MTLEMRRIHRPSEHAISAGKRKTLTMDNQCIYCGYLGGKHNEVCTVAELRRQLECTGMSPQAAENVVGLFAALIAGRFHYERRSHSAGEKHGD
jgi:hypothetical protein